jgi:hypothetical protein
MLQFRFVPHNDFLLVHLAGLVSLDAWEKVLRELGDTLRDRPGDRLVVNLMELLGWLGIPERQAVGALMATHFAQMKKVALVIQPLKIAGVVEAEAQRRGLDLRLFSSYDEAISWVVS